MQKIRRGEVYYADLGQMAGCETRGRSPVLILQSDEGLHSSPTVIVAPITSRHQGGCHEMHVQLEDIRHYQTKDRASLWYSIALLEQIRAIDRSRLGRYLCRVSNAKMIEAEQALKFCLGLKT